VFCDVEAELFTGLYYLSEFYVSKDSDGFTIDSSVKVYLRDFYYR
jgi:hypothetical protein